MAQVMEGIRKMEEMNGKKFGNFEESAVSFGSLRSKSFHAGDDGYHFKPWFKR